MIQPWGNIPTFIPPAQLFNMPQISNVPQTQTFTFIPFGRITATPCSVQPFIPTPQGVSLYSNPINFFNIQIPDLSKFTMPAFPKIWNNITTTTSNLYNSARQTASSTLTSVTNFGSRMVDTAKKYLGYNEKDGSYKKFTGGRNEAWCADFATFVARENGSNIPHFSAVSDILSWGKSNGKFSKTPKVGDLVIYKGHDKNGKQVSHTGIVKSVENGIIKTIEGNTSKGDVAERTCSVNDSRITGFVSVA